jgi:hypothetical protein
MREKRDCAALVILKCDLVLCRAAWDRLNDNVLRCQASRGLFTVAVRPLSANHAASGFAMGLEHSQLPHHPQGCVDRQALPSLTAPGFMPSIYQVAMDARSVDSICVRSYVLRPSASLKRPRHGDLSAQADEHLPHLQGASICQPAPASCEAAHSRWLRRSLPTWQRCPWPAGDQEHSEWATSHQQRAKRGSIASPSKACLQAAQKQCEDMRLTIGRSLGGIHCFRSLRHVWRASATVRSTKLSVWFRTKLVI